jgi:sugar lactone lactonase YvrE
MRRSRAVLAATASAAAVLALAPAVPVAAAAPAARPSRYLIDPVGPAADGVFPEGIALRGDRFFVGSTADGTIYRGDVDGRRATPFLLGGRDNRTSSVGMKVSDGKLFVAGGATGRVFAYNLSNRRLVGSWQVPQTGAPTFLNDIAVGRNGAVYVTDSARPVLYRLRPSQQRTNGVKTLPTFVSFTGTALQYATGNNANGIVASADGRFLVIAQSNAKKLFRVRLSDRRVTQVNLHGQSVAGDGLVLRGRTLHAVERQGDVGYIVKINLARRLASGNLVSRTTYPSLNDPTTAAALGKSLLVVNSQFGERSAGVQPGPFTVSRVPAP